MGKTDGICLAYRYALKGYFGVFPDEAKFNKRDLLNYGIY